MLGTTPLGALKVPLLPISVDVGGDTSPLLIIARPEGELDPVGVGGGVADERIFVDPGLKPVGGEPSEGRIPLGADGGVTVGTDGRTLLTGSNGGIVGVLPVN